MKSDVVVSLAPTWFQADLETNLLVHWEIPCGLIAQWYGKTVLPTHCKGPEAIRGMFYFLICETSI